MAIEEEDDGGGVPEWVVTFGDMMSLLLTFFIMLVSLSEIKEEEQYQALVESIRHQFGHDASLTSLVPGTAKPRNSALAKLATQGRARKLDLMSGGDKVQAPVGDHPRVVMVRPGSKSAIGAVIFFEEEAQELTDQHRQVLRELALVVGGKPQKIEIRGHVSRRIAAAGDREKPLGWNVGYARCVAAMQYLVEDLQIQQKRIRLSVAGANEPLHLGSDPIKLKENSRVEVFMLDEVVTDLEGTDTQQQTRFSDGAAADAP